MINIERENHLNRILPFIESEGPDVLCLQEVCEKDLTLFEALGYTGDFLPETQYRLGGVPITDGTALLSRYPLDNFKSYYYQGSRESVGIFYDDDVIGTQQKSILHADCIINGEIFTIATTHFTWTPNGSVASDTQKESMTKFSAYISKMKPHVMCGDFNIPRNLNPLYQELCKHYTDAIPLTYASSLDRTLHKGGDDPRKANLFDSYMVDYIFTQPPYTATDVRLEFGLSDHAGVIATISKAK